MLIMFEEGTRGGMVHTIYRYAEANNKYMKNYDTNIKSSYLQYLDANNLYGWAMSQKLPVNNFKWVKKDDISNFNENFIKNYDKNSDKGYILEVDVEYPKNLDKLHSDLPFLPERMKINKHSKLTCNAYNKENYVDHIMALKQALNNGLILKKVHRIIQFNQEAWLKPYIDMNTRLRKEAKNDFEKAFYKLMNNSIFGKTMENARKHRDIKIVTTNKQKCKLASEPNYHSTKYISKNLLIMEMKKVEVKINKPVYIGQAVLDISKIRMYECWYNYIKPMYKDNARLCYMDFYKDISHDLEKWFDTSNYDEKDERPLPIGKNKKEIGLFKDELGGKIMKELASLRLKAYAYIMDDDSEHKKGRGTKKRVINFKRVFEHYRESIFINKNILKPQQRFKSDYIEFIQKKLII